MASETLDRTPQQKCIVAAYPYRDSQRKLRYEVVRFPDKSFAHRQPDGHGGYHWGMEGVERLPYRLPEVLASTGTVYIVEGERDSDRGAAEGLTTTCNSGGAGNWKPELNQFFAGRDIVIIPDNDRRGLDHADRVSRELYGIAKTVKVAWLPGLPPKGDLSDWFDAGRTVAELEDYAERTPFFEVEEPQAAPALRDVEGAIRELSVSATTIGNVVLAERKNPFIGADEVSTEVSPVEFVSKPLGMALGSTGELVGKVKLGKTSLILDGVRQIVTGHSFLGSPTLKTPVVYLTEQPPATFRASLERAGLLGFSELRILHYKDVIGMSWDAIVSLTLAECKKWKAKLIVVDTIGQFAGLGGDSENDSGAALAAMRPLQAAAGNGMAVHVLRHERKSGGDLGDSGRGSSAFAGAVDTVMSLRRLEGHGRPTLRQLRAISRIDGVPEESVIEQTTEGYVLRGSETEIAVAEAREAILAELPNTEAEAEDLKSLLDRTKLKRTTAQAAIDALIATGEVRRAGTGKRGDAYKFWRELVSAETHSPIERQKEKEGKPMPLSNPPETFSEIEEVV